MANNRFDLPMSSLCRPRQLYLQESQRTILNTILCLHSISPSCFALFYYHCNLPLLETEALPYSGSQKGNAAMLPAIIPHRRQTRILLLLAALLATLTMFNSHLFYHHHPVPNLIQKLHTFVLQRLFAKEEEQPS